MTTWPARNNDDDALAAALRVLRDGGIVLIADSADRENELDMACSARHATPELVNLLLREASGVLCIAIDEPVAERLGIARLARSGEDPFETPFGFPISSSATDCSPVCLEGRAHTVRLAADPAATAGDFVIPGHLSTLIARPGGLAERQGHTEAIVDLLKLAGEPPVGVLCEVIGARGGMADLSEIQDRFPQAGFPLVTIEEIQAALGGVAAERS